MKFLLRTVVFLLLLPFIALSQPDFELGVNLVSDGAFVNIINHTARYSNASGYDEQGWPLSDFDLVLLDGRPATEWTGAIDDPEEYRVDYSGRYAGSFRGSGTVQASGTSVSVENTAYDAQTNTTSFEIVIGGFPGANHGLVFLSFTNTSRTPAAPLNTGITELKVHRPGYPLNTNKVFTDEYLALCKAADFACYRYYTMQNIWNGEPAYPEKTLWADRKIPADASQNSMANINGKRDAWCWEYIVQLSIILKKDIWVCIHLSCDENYVKNLAQFLKDSLDPAINIYVESSNELWSPTQTTHGPYNQADAQARGITFDQNHARRTVELSQWFAEVFGQSEINKRIRVIMAGQHAYNGRSDNHLNYINDTFGPPKDYIYANSIALYFGSSNASSTDPDAIVSGMIDNINSQINDTQVSTYRKNHLDKAVSWDLPGGCTSYEGGPHLPAGGGTTNLDAQILAHRTEGMEQVLMHNFIQGWEELGGGLAMYFTLSSSYNRYGCWGLTDDYTNPDRNHKMEAVRKIIAQTSTAVGPVLTLLPSTLSVSPNPASTSFTLHYDGKADARITDVLGRTLWKGQVDRTALVNTANWMPGLYFVITGQQVVKLVKR
jgi:hypothetical protein